jgi:hypothetical protein
MVRRETVWEFRLGDHSRFLDCPAKKRLANAASEDRRDIAVSALEGGRPC